MLFFDDPNTHELATLIFKVSNSRQHNATLSRTLNLWTAIYLQYSSGGVLLASIFMAAQGRLLPKIVQSHANMTLFEVCHRSACFAIFQKIIIYIFFILMNSSLVLAYVFAWFDFREKKKIKGYKYRIIYKYPAADSVNKLLHAAIVSCVCLLFVCIYCLLLF